jgi:hypothetical protein
LSAQRDSGSRRRGDGSEGDFERLHGNEILLNEGKIECGGNKDEARRWGEIGRFN